MTRKSGGLVSAVKRKATRPARPRSEEARSEPTYGGSLADAGQAVGRFGDEGIDGIIKEDKLGLDVVCIQAKRWKNPLATEVGGLRRRTKKAETLSFRG
jgi:hypothetical protein